jgi:hypothetical protein
MVQMTDIVLIDGRGDELPIEKMEVHMSGETKIWFRLITKSGYKVDTYHFRGEL